MLVQFRASPWKSGLALSLSSGDQQDLESHTKVAEPPLAGALNDCREQSLPLT